MSEYILDEIRIQKTKTSALIWFIESRKDRWGKTRKYILTQKRDQTWARKWRREDRNLDISLILPLKVFDKLVMLIKSMEGKK